MITPKEYNYLAGFWDRRSKSNMAIMSNKEFEVLGDVLNMLNSQLVQDYYQKKRATSR